MVVLQRMPIAHHPEVTGLNDTEMAHLQPMALDWTVIPSVACGFVIGRGLATRNCHLVSMRTANQARRLMDGLSKMGTTPV